MQMSKQDYNNSVERADKAFARWCQDNDIPLHGIKHVITWEEWDNGIGVYIFLHTLAEVESLSTGRIDEMKSTYRSYLREHKYPYDKFPNVTFEIDSDENVRKNYCGSYFFRLR